MTMRKDLNDYSLYVFDLDGTLYDQPRLRKMMAARLMFYYMFHPFSVKELFILSHFRKVKDSWTKSSAEEDIIKKTAEDMKADPAKVADIVKRWIYDDPLSLLLKVRDERLIAWMNKLKSAGKKVVVLSDYPARRKLEAMNVTVDRVYDPDDERITELKPSAVGLSVIMDELGIPAGDTIMIGDRDEKDGESARLAGADYLILMRSISKRKIDEI
jgi:FMN phosphatase YigB (HAD superfamily)